MEEYIREVELSDVDTEVFYTDDLGFALEWVWQQTSSVINNYKTPKICKWFEDNLEDISCKVYRGISFYGDDSLSDEAILDFILSKTNKCKFISTSTSLRIATGFSRDNRPEFPDCTAYQVVIEIDVDRGYRIKYRDMNEEEIMVIPTDIKGCKIVSINKGGMNKIQF